MHLFHLDLQHVSRIPTVLLSLYPTSILITGEPVFCCHPPQTMVSSLAFPLVSQSSRFSPKGRVLLRSAQPLPLGTTIHPWNSPKRSCCWSKPRPGSLFSLHIYFSTKTVQNSYKTLVWGWAMTLIQKIIPMQSHQFHNLQGNR